MKNPIPNILSKISNPRYQVKIGEHFTWSNKLFTNNIFRVYELIFGRKVGIRAGSSSWKEIDENGIEHQYHLCFSWEDRIAYIETFIRYKLHSVIYRLKRIRLPEFKFNDLFQPAFVFEGFNYIPQTKSNRDGYLFAIAVDASSSGTYGTSPRTWSHTCTGSNLILVLAGFSFGSATTSSYNSVSMTNLGTYTYTAGTSRYGCLNYLLNPSTGSNTVSFSPGGDGIAVVTSYTGVAQSGQPDAAINTQTTNSGTSLTATVTVTASGSWLITGTITEGAALTAGTGATLRITGSNVAVAMFDSNGAPGTGSQSMTISESPASGFAIGMVSIAPVQASGPTNVKTWDGVTQSTGIKTYEAVTTANTKSVIGVS